MKLKLHVFFFPCLMGDGDAVQHRIQKNLEPADL